MPRTPNLNSAHVRQTPTHGVTIYQSLESDRHGKKAYTDQWYMRKMVNGATHRFALGLGLRAAMKRADEIASFLSIPSNSLDMAIAAYDPRSIARATHIATIGECLDAYKAALHIIGRRGKEVSLSSYTGYRSFLLTILRKVEAYRAGKTFVSKSGERNVDWTPWLALPTSHLTARLAMDFKLASVPPDEDEPDEEEKLTAKISADTALRNGRSIFSVRALQYYREINLNLPDLGPFLAEPTFGAKKYFQLLAPDVTVRIMRDSLELRIKDLDAYRAFILCTQVGLRAGEAKAFALSNLRDEAQPTVYVTTNGEFNPKHGHGRRVFVAPWVAKLLREIGPIETAEAIDNLNTWLRARGVNVGKPTHELRKMWFSAKVKNDGLLAASQQGGHKDPKITSDYYADNTMAEWLMPLWQAETGAAITLPQFKAVA